MPRNNSTHSLHPYFPFLPWRRKGWWDAWCWRRAPAWPAMVAFLTVSGVYCPFPSMPTDNGFRCVLDTAKYICFLLSSYSVCLPAMADMDAQYNLHYWKSFKVFSWSIKLNSFFDGQIIKSYWLSCAFACKKIANFGGGHCCWWKLQVKFIFFVYLIVPHYRRSPANISDYAWVTSSGVCVASMNDEPFPTVNHVDVNGSVGIERSNFWNVSTVKG